MVKALFPQTGLLRRNTMKQTIEELKNLITIFADRFTAIPEPEFSYKPTPARWSKKEVIGHLIDSAQNNLRRFICSQYETIPPKITYDQEFWVASNDYQQAEKEDLILLWKLLNGRICNVLAKMPESNYIRQCDTGSLKTLQWLAEDYVRHMKHHFNQIIPSSFDIVYP
jgi:hypothetical protein